MTNNGIGIVILISIFAHIAHDNSVEAGGANYCF
jgi:hypothetical protein